MILSLTVGLSVMSMAVLAQGSIANSADGIHPLLIGSTVPDVTVDDINGKSVKLSELVKQNPTVLIFYRGGWCPYCNRQMSDLQKIEPTLLKEGYRIVAISADQPEMLRQSIDKHGLTYDLYSDSDAKASQAFGIAFHVADKTVSEYKTYGIDLDQTSGNNRHILPVPAVFLCDTDGMIRFEYVNPNYKVRLDGQVLLAAAKAYRE